MNIFFTYIYQQPYPVILTWTLVIIAILVILLFCLYYFPHHRTPILIITLLIIVLIILISGLYSYCVIMMSDLDKLDIKYMEKPRIKSDSRVVISLTTIPSRIKYLEYTIKSLLNQKYRVDEIYLWLPDKTMKGKKYDIPEKLMNLKNLNIKICNHDYGPATKLIYTLLEEELDTKIIVVDDDMIYRYNLVDKLVNMSQKYPDAAIATVGLYMNSKNDHAKVSDILNVKSKKVDRVLGTTGFLVKPKFFHDGKLVEGDCFDYSKAPKEAIWVDDIWFSGHLAKRGVDIYRLPRGLFNLPIETIHFNSKEKNQILHIDHNLSTDNYRKTYEYFKEYLEK